MQRLSAETTQEQILTGEPSVSADEPIPEGQHCTGRVKWFDATRGFGFLVSDDCEGDVLIHFSVLKEHGRRSLPEGATVECIAAHQDRGFQARKILSIDLSTALPMPPRPVHSPAERADRKALAEAAGEYEPVEVKWFNRVKGYGFLNRVADGEEDQSAAHRGLVHLVQDHRGQTRRAHPRANEAEEGDRLVREIRGRRGEAHPGLAGQVRR